MDSKRMRKDSRYWGRHLQQFFMLAKCSTCRYSKVVYPVVEGGWCTFHGARSRDEDFVCQENGGGYAGVVVNYGLEDDE